MGIAAERARELLTYDPINGTFRWAKAVSLAVKAGDLAGSWRPQRDGQSYLIIKIDGVDYRAHRLAWLMVYDEEPEGQVDHRDGCKSNNRISNLRVVTDSQNKVNRPASRRSESGMKGVRWHKRDRLWVASITIGRRQRYIGGFKTAEAAQAAYQAEALKVHGEFAHHG